jgi:hypothetical protein
MVFTGAGEEGGRVNQRSKYRQLSPKNLSLRLCSKNATWVHMKQIFFRQQLHFTNKRASLPWCLHITTLYFLSTLPVILQRLCDASSVTRRERGFCRSFVKALGKQASFAVRVVNNAWHGQERAGDTSGVWMKTTQRARWRDPTSFLSVVSATAWLVDPHPRVSLMQSDLRDDAFFFDAIFIADCNTSFRHSDHWTCVFPVTYFKLLDAMSAPCREHTFCIHQAHIWQHLMVLQYIYAIFESQSRPIWRWKIFSV